MNPLDPFATAAFDGNPMAEPIDPPIVLTGGAPRAQDTPVAFYGVAPLDPPIVVTGG